MVRNARTVASIFGILSAAATVMPARAADPTTADCLSANNRSVDLRNDNKLRAARAQLLVCAAASCPSDVRKECLRRVDEVNAEIPTIIFDAKDAIAGKDLAAIKVTMDGEVIAERLEGTPISVDPGTHSFVFDTPGRSAVSITGIIVQQSQKDRRVEVTWSSPRRVEGVDEAGGGPGQAAAAVGEGGPQRSDNREGGLGTQRLFGIVVATVGVVGLGVGTAFGLMTISKKHDAETVCPDQCASEAGVAAWNDAHSAGNISTVAFVVGGLGVVGGAALWFTAPSGGPGARLGLGPSGVQLKGAW
jgi:hypothetical protein